VWDDISNELRSKAQFERLKVDDNEADATKFGFTGGGGIAFYDGDSGKLLNTIKGFPSSKEGFKDHILSLLAN
jgi:hypothetical protein